MFKLARTSSIAFILCLSSFEFAFGQDVGALLGLNQDMLNQVTETGKIHSVTRDGRINITTANGRKTVELPPPGHNLGVRTQINVSGKTDLKFLQRGMAIHVTCKINKKNRLAEPAERIVVFTPNRTTNFGFQDEMLAEKQEGDIRPVELIASVTSIKKDKIFAIYGTRRDRKRIEIPVKKDMEIELNGSDFSFAKPGDEITATGYVIRKPILMAHTINIVRSNDAQEKQEANGKDGKKKAKTAGKKNAKTGKGKTAKGKNAKGKDAGKTKPAKMVQIDQNKDKKRTRKRAGRAYKIN